MDFHTNPKLQRKYKKIKEKTPHDQDRKRENKNEPKLKRTLTLRKTTTTHTRKVTSQTSARRAEEFRVPKPKTGHTEPLVPCGDAIAQMYVDEDRITDDTEVIDMYLWDKLQ